MSHVSKDEEVKRILANTGSDDSKEKISKKEKVNKNDDYNEYDENNDDPLVNKEMDDKEW